MDTHDYLLTRIARLESHLAQESLARRDAQTLAASAGEVKHRLLASLSHELRTPLNGLIGAAELAMQLEMPVEVREYLDLIRRSSTSLNEVLDGILEVSRLEAGQLVLHPVTFDVLGAIAETVAQQAAAARRKHLELSLVQADRQPLFVEGDAVRFRQVLSHLIGNAIKFTQAGSVKVNAYALQRPGGIRDLTILVSDTGVGIRPEDHDRVFTMFAQGDGSLAQPYGGTGLGLAVSQGLARLMGGEIGVSGAPGQGATFVLRLEMPEREPAPATASPPTAAIEVADANVGAGLRVLLAEDNPVNRLLALRILEKAGCVVDIAENGAVALQMWRDGAYAAVFMDIQMPVMDGLQATRLIRAGESDDRHVPIIAVTANAMAGDREICLAAGMDDYVAKPIRPADLVNALRRWCATIAQPA